MPNKVFPIYRRVENVFVIKINKDLSTLWVDITDFHFGINVTKTSFDDDFIRHSEHITKDEFDKIYQEIKEKLENVLQK